MIDDLKVNENTLSGILRSSTSYFLTLGDNSGNEILFQSSQSQVLHLHLYTVISLNPLTSTFTLRVLALIFELHQCHKVWKQHLIYMYAYIYVYIHIYILLTSCNIFIPYIFIYTYNGKSIIHELIPSLTAHCNYIYINQASKLYY